VLQVAVGDAGLGRRRDMQSGYRGAENWP
jgi:hypothetical protein